MCFISITKIRCLKYTCCMTFVIFIVSYYSWSCDTKMKSWCFCRHICRHALPAKLCNKKYKRVLLSVYLSFTENVLPRNVLLVSLFFTVSFGFECINTYEWILLKWTTLFDTACNLIPFKQYEWVNEGTTH